VSIAQITNYSDFLAAEIKISENPYLHYNREKTLIFSQRP